MEGEPVGWGRVKHKGGKSVKANTHDTGRHREPPRRAEKVKAYDTEITQNIKNKQNPVMLP